MGIMSCEKGWWFGECSGSLVSTSEEDKLLGSGVSVRWWDERANTAWTPRYFSRYSGEGVPTQHQCCSPSLMLPIPPGLPMDHEANWYFPTRKGVQCMPQEREQSAGGVGNHFTLSFRRGAGWAFGDFPSLALRISCLVSGDWHLLRPDPPRSALSHLPSVSSYIHLFTHYRWVSPMWFACQPDVNNQRCFILYVPGQKCIL